MYFCPNCGNLLLFELESNGMKLKCKLCPYIYIVNHTIKSVSKCKQKTIDDVLGGKEAWSIAEKTTVNCPNPNCHHTKAYFMQIQIRSADEPATIFYRCEQCSFQWKEG